MANAFIMFEHRYSRILCHGPDQTFPTARNNQIDNAFELQQLHDGFTVRSVYEGDDALMQAFLPGSILHDAYDYPVRVDRFRPSPEDDGIARLQAETCCIDCHIRPRLINDADYADRNLHLADIHAVRSLYHPDDLTDGIRKHGNLGKSLHHLCNPFFSDCQTVDQGL